MAEIVRKYPPAPLVGVGALVFDQGKILLIRRAEEPSRGDWSIPGGLVEVGESLREAVVRETLEETGLLVEPQHFVELVERIIPDEDGKILYHYVLADYVCRVVDGKTKPGSDAAEAVWAGEQDLPRYNLAPITSRLILKVLSDQFITNLSSDE
ncbi:MAG: 8-oxo-dGTP diphosphatase [Thermodesulfobacteriota bacterium]|nr:8-oxo-dGTP diphosphatase [Thermodesulfobacteriota bacterium]